MRDDIVGLKGQAAIEDSKIRGLASRAQTLLTMIKRACQQNQLLKVSVALSNGHKRIAREPVLDNQNIISRAISAAQGLANYSNVVSTTMNPFGGANGIEAVLDQSLAAITTIASQAQPEEPDSRIAFPQVTSFEIARAYYQMVWNAYKQLKFESDPLFATQAAAFIYDGSRIGYAAAAQALTDLETQRVSIVNQMNATTEPNAYFTLNMALSQILDWKQEATTMKNELGIASNTGLTTRAKKMQEALAEEMINVKGQARAIAELATAYQRSSNNDDRTRLQNLIGQALSQVQNGRTRIYNIWGGGTNEPELENIYKMALQEEQQALASAAVINYASTQWNQYTKEYGAVDMISTFRYDSHQAPELATQIEQFGEKGREKTARIMNFEQGKVKNTSLYWYYDNNALMNDQLADRALRRVDYMRGDSYYMTGQAFYTNAVENKELLKTIDEYTELQVAPEDPAIQNYLRIQQGVGSLLQDRYLKQRISHYYNIDPSRPRNDALQKTQLQVYEEVQTATGPTLKMRVSETIYEGEKNYERPVSVLGDRQVASIANMLSRSPLQSPLNLPPPNVTGVQAQDSYYIYSAEYLGTAIVPGCSGSGCPSANRLDLDMDIGVRAADADDLDYVVQIARYPEGSWQKTYILYTGDERQERIHRSIQLKRGSEVDVETVKIYQLDEFGAMRKEITLNAAGLTLQQVLAGAPPLIRTIKASDQYPILTIQEFSGPKDYEVVKTVEKYRRILRPVRDAVGRTISHAVKNELESHTTYLRDEQGRLTSSVTISYPPYGLRTSRVTKTEYEGPRGREKPVKMTEDDGIDHYYDYFERPYQDAAGNTKTESLTIAHTNPNGFRFYDPRPALCALRRASALPWAVTNWPNLWAILFIRRIQTTPRFFQTKKG